MGIIEKVRRFYCHRCGFVTYDENTLLSDKVKFIASEQQAATTEICEQRTADKLRWEVDKRKSEVAAAVRARDKGELEFLKVIDTNRLPSYTKTQIHERIEALESRLKESHPITSEDTKGTA